MSFHSDSYGDIWNQIILGVREKPLHETTEVGVLSYTIENNFKKNKKKNKNSSNFATIRRFRKKNGSFMEARPKGPSAFATPGGKKKQVVENGGSKY